MTEVVKEGTEELKTWFYDKGIENELINNWNLFKELIVKFCSEQDIDSLRKFADETWSRVL